MSAMQDEDVTDGPVNRAVSVKYPSESDHIHSLDGVTPRGSRQTRPHVPETTYGAGAASDNQFQSPVADIGRQLQQMKLDEYMNNGSSAVENNSCHQRSETSSGSGPRCNNESRLSIGNRVTQNQHKELDKFAKARTSAQSSLFHPEDSCERKQVKVTDINQDVFMKVCNLLRVYRVLGGDYRTLGGKLGYKVMDIKNFEYEKNAAESLLLDWAAGKGHYVEEIITKLKEMDRDDVVQLLEAEVKRISNMCNCESCGNLS